MAFKGIKQPRTRAETCGQVIYTSRVLFLSLTGYFLKVGILPKHIKAYMMDQFTCLDCRIFSGLTVLYCFFFLGAFTEWSSWIYLYVLLFRLYVAAAIV